MDWNRRYELNDTPWERDEPTPPLAEFVERQGPLSGKVLVPGCGLGRDARYLAAHGSEVVGVDIAPQALHRAREQEPPPRGSVSYLLEDFLQPHSRVPQAHFDWVFEHTCFCAIDPDRRADYVAAAGNALQSGGRLLAILFTDLEDADGPPYPATRPEIETLFSPYFEIIDQWKPTRCYPGRENEETVFLMTKR